MRIEGPAWKDLVRLPDVISWSGLVCGLTALYAGGVQQRFGLAFGLLFAAGVLDLCDGAVARAMGQARAFGGYFDTMVDTIIFLPVVSVLTWQLGVRFLPLHLLFNTCGALRHARLLAYPQIKRHGVPSTVAGFIFPLGYAVAGWLGLGPAQVAQVLSAVMVLHALGMVARVDLRVRRREPEPTEEAAG